MFVLTLTNAAWAITNSHNVINDVAYHVSAVKPIPGFFSQAAFRDQNDFKQKKCAKPKLYATDLKSHSNDLYSILLSGNTQATAEWASFREEVNQLADCLKRYAEYLDEKSEKIATNHSLLRPVRSVSSHATVEPRYPTSKINPWYQLLDEALKTTGENKPVIFDEELHLEKPFSNNMQRFKYFNELALSIPLNLFKFSPGGSIITTHILVHVAAQQTEAEMITEGAKFMAQSQMLVKEYHTRGMRKAFAKKVERVASITPAVREFIYKELTGDAFTPANKAMQERMQLLALGNEDIVADLRTLNEGRPTTFDVFFDHLKQVIEEVMAADERRHGVAHFSEWLSLEELVKRAADLCPPETPIPSKDLVRLQMTPRNRYSHAALNFTSRFPIQYKIQVRQLRKFHEDAHYCAAGFLYFRFRAIEEIGDKSLVVMQDDKAKCQVGDPGLAVSTGVRGKKTLCPTSSTLSAADHDITRSSITPSVYLESDVPDLPKESFVQGKVHVSVNDTVTNTSNPFKHAAMFCKIAEAKEEETGIKISTGMKFSDGGTDQRTNLIQVQLSNVCIFKELELDFLVHARCAPGQSYSNPAERCMSILNLGLQNCTLQCSSGSPEFEKSIKNCNSMSALREKFERKPDLKTEWLESLEAPIGLVEGRFSRLKLKNEPFVVEKPITSDNADVIKSHLKGLFPDLDLSKLQKQYTDKCKSLTIWMQDHARVSHYLFQLRKCDDPSCCPPLRGEKPAWLPDPMLDSENKDHFLPYEKAKTMDTSEKDRPSNKKATCATGNKPSNKKRSASASTSTPAAAVLMEGDETEEYVPMDLPQGPASIYTNQNARAYVTCSECRKPRVSGADKVLIMPFFCKDLLKAEIFRKVSYIYIDHKNAWRQPFFFILDPLL